MYSRFKQPAALAAAGNNWLSQQALISILILTSTFPSDCQSRSDCCYRHTLGLLLWFASSVVCLCLLKTQVLLLTHSTCELFPLDFRHMWPLRGSNYADWLTMFLKSEWGWHYLVPFYVLGIYDILVYLIPTWQNFWGLFFFLSLIFVPTKWK